VSSAKVSHGVVAPPWIGVTRASIMTLPSLGMRKRTGVARPDSVPPSSRRDAPIAEASSRSSGGPAGIKASKCSW
jgi:hypothetical protein